MAPIQDGWQDSQQHAQVEDWLKISGVWFLLQVSILNGGAMSDFSDFW